MGTTCTNNVCGGKYDMHSEMKISPTVKTTDEWQKEDPNIQERCKGWPWEDLCFTSRTVCDVFGPQG